MGMDQLQVVESINESREWLQRIKRGLYYERERRADPREVDMLIESLEAELRRLLELVRQE